MRKVRMNLGLSTLGVFALALVATTFASEQAPVPLRFEDVIAQKAIVEPLGISLSPDGRYVAYTSQDLQKRTEVAENKSELLFTKTLVPGFLVATDIWLVDVQSSISKNLTESKGSNWAPTWSPDGTQLAFYSDRDGVAHLWLWERATGALRRISDTVIFSFNSDAGNRPLWTPNGKGIVVKAVPPQWDLDEARAVGSKPHLNEVKKPDVPRSTVTIYYSEAADPQRVSLRSGGWDPEYTRAELSLVSVDTGKAHVLTDGLKPHWFGVSPDGSAVLYVQGAGNAPENKFQPVYDLGFISLKTFQQKLLATHIKLSWTGASVSWSPDSRSVAYITGGPIADGSVSIISVDSGTARSVKVGPHPEYESDLQRPMWDVAGKYLYMFAGSAVWEVSATEGTAREVGSITGHKISQLIRQSDGDSPWSPDGRSLYVFARDEESQKQGIYRISLRDGSVSRITEEDRVYGSFDALNNPRLVVFVSENAKQSPDIWITKDFGSEKQLTHVNPQFERYVFGDTRLIEWRTLDGAIIHGALLLPSGYKPGTKVPLIVWVYGGGYLSRDLNEFWSGIMTPDTKLLTTRGYAVLLPDAPTKTESPMLSIAQAVLPGVNKIIDLGIADPDRLGVMGESYGGYSTLSLLVQTTRFRAAVEEFGFGDLLEMYGSIRSDGAADNVTVAEDGQDKMRSTPWQNRSKYIENSPIYYLDRSCTPLLVVQGTLDERVPSLAGDQIFVALRRLGTEVEYAKFKGEGHGIRARANVLQLWGLMIDWFDSHLKIPEISELKRSE